MGLWYRYGYLDMPRAECGVAVRVRADDAHGLALVAYVGWVMGYVELLKLYIPMVEVWFDHGPGSVRSGPVPSRPVWLPTASEQIQRNATPRNNTTQRNA